jgi:hypothetical protein
MIRWRPRPGPGLGRRSHQASDAGIAVKPVAPGICAWGRLTRRRPHPARSPARRSDRATAARKRIEHNARLVLDRERIGRRNPHTRPAATAPDLLPDQCRLRGEAAPTNQACKPHREFPVGSTLDRFHRRRNDRCPAAYTAGDSLPNLRPFGLVFVTAAEAVEREIHTRLNLSGTQLHQRSTQRVTRQTGDGKNGAQRRRA